MNIVAAGPDDIDPLVDLMHAFYAESDHRLDRAWAAASFGRLLGEPRLGGAWMARIDGEAAGYVVVTLRHSMEHGALDGFIDDLFVRPQFRRRGVARSLLRALFDDCASRSVAALHVEVGRDNPAAGNLYEAFGLAEVDRRVLTALLPPNSR